MRGSKPWASFTRRISSFQRGLFNEAFYCPQVLYIPQTLTSTLAQGE